MIMFVDIQPMGTTPDPNIQSDLGPQNYNVDVSSQKEVVSDSYSGMSERCLAYITIFA